jgi:hypothetical protein
MKAREPTSHLRRDVPIGPRPQFDLHRLLAKELGITTLRRRRGWIAWILYLFGRDKRHEEQKWQT